MTRRLAWAGWITLALAACAGNGPASGKPSGAPGTVKGDTSALDPAVRAYDEKLRVELADVRKLTADELEQQAALPFPAALGYDPMSAANLDSIQTSSLKLESQELEVLKQRGFVISGRQSFPTFTYGYASIYASDLPVYISADSIMDALHRSYDEILSQLELALLQPELIALLNDLQQRLSEQPESQTRRDLDVYLAVARGLLTGDGGAVADGDQNAIDDLISKANAADATTAIELFGVKREIDASQFKPRGHYEDDPQLQSYFRAMVWLGKIDFRLVETDDDGKQWLRRPQVEAMVLLHSLFGAADKQHFSRIDDAVRAFVGESDNMTLSQVPDLLAALGVKQPSGLAAIEDDTLRKTILEQGFGKQQILSDLLKGGLDAPRPFNASFLLFGQRYVVDSHVFSNVVWDRVRANGDVKRMLPDPLDVAYAALGNDQAVSLLQAGLHEYAYAGDLAAMRTLVDEHDADFWQKNLYNDWLSALRALSPSRAEIKDAHAAGMPSVTATEAWGRRMLNSQLGSWAQLRHDTLLYAKQSYTGEPACHFPDAALDPYPEFYAAVGRFADHGYALADLTEGTAAVMLGDTMRDYFGQLRDVAHALEAIAKAERSGASLTQDELDFINDAVVIKKVSVVCTSIDKAAGWYTRMFFNQDKTLQYDPTIADVHTQPTDEFGNDLGRILHVATARPRLMVVTDDGCGAPKAYVGLVTAYYEQLTDHWKRMADSDWSTQLESAGPPDEVSWMQDLVPLPK